MTIYSPVQRYLVPQFIVLGVLVFQAQLAQAYVERTNAEGVVAEDGTCIAPDGIAVISVSVDNIQVVEGNLRAQIYGDDPEDFLAKGKKLVRVDVPVVTTDTSTICVPLPAPGVYALVVMHDKNSNGKADFFSEGFGFSNNPKLSFGPPDAEDVMINVAPGVNQQAVTLNYIFGADSEKKEKRRKLRRR